MFTRCFQVLASHGNFHQASLCSTDCIGKLEAGWDSFSDSRECDSALHWSDNESCEAELVVDLCVCDAAGADGESGQ